MGPLHDLRAEIAVHLERAISKSCQGMHDSDPVVCVLRGASRDELAACDDL
jgi:hypothetical protein